MNLGFHLFIQIIDEGDFEANAAQDFFQNHLMKLEPHLLTDLGMKYVKIIESFYLI